MGSKKKALRVAAVLLVLGVVLVAPTGYFYVTYMVPMTALPKISAETGEIWSAPGMEPELSSELHEELIASRARVSAPSFSAAIAFDGALQWAGTVGYSTVETEETATLDSRYRLGSTSKAMTGAMLGRLVSDRVIELDRAIGEYVDDLPAPYAALTARQLASHTGGVRHYSRLPTYWPGSLASMSSKHYPSVKDGLAIFIDDPLEFTPGEDFGYSTFGYSLLSYAMEGASGQSFESLMQGMFDQLSMTDTAFDLPQESSGRVSFYVSGTGKYSRAYPSGASYKLAGGASSRARLMSRDSASRCLATASSMLPPRRCFLRRSSSRTAATILRPTRWAFESRGRSGFSARIDPRRSFTTAAAKTEAHRFS